MTTGVGVGATAARARRWSPEKSLAHAPTYLFDTSVAASITADGSNNVSALADARASGTKTANASGGARPVLHPEITLDGQPAIVFSHSASSKMRVDPSAASIGNAPFAIFEIAKYTSSQDYASALTLGGSQTGGPFPENATLGTLVGRDFSGYLAGAFAQGYGGCEGRLAVDTSRACTRLLVSDGVRTRMWIDGTQVLQVDGLTFATKSAEIALGGESVTGFGQTMDHEAYYGFVQYGGGGTLSTAEVRRLLRWARTTRPSLARSRRVIVHGTSIDRNYPNASGLAGAWLQLAADAAAHPWEVKNYSVVGMGAGMLPNANGTALYGVGGTAATPTAGATGAAAQWSSIWDISPQNLAGLYFSGTLATNDLYFGATAAQVFTFLQVLGALVLASGGTYVVCTPTPRQDVGTPSVRVLAATNASPIEITCDSAHGLADGATVTIVNSAGNTAANGARTIHVTGPTTFTLDGTTGNGVYTGNGYGHWAGKYTAFETERTALLALIAAHWQSTMGAILVTGATNASPIEITTDGAHGRSTGDTVSLAQVLGNTAANGTRTVTVTGTTTFTLDGSTGNGAYTGNGVAYWGSGLGGTALADFAGRAEFQDCTDTTYYLPDKVHWKAALQTIAGQMVTSILDASG